LLVGAGPATRQDFEDASRFARNVIAVDGGFNSLALWGVQPQAVLGDMDSTRSDIPDGVTVLPIAEQDTTDLEKALRAVTAPLIIGIGFTGGRLDHTLAAMHALVAADTPVILIGDKDAVFAAPTEWRAELEERTRISFFPMRRVSAVGSKGLRWPVDGLLMEGGRMIGVSNEVASSRVAVWFGEPGAVTILPRSCLPAIVASLS